MDNDTNWVKGGYAVKQPDGWRIHTIATNGVKDWIDDGVVSYPSREVAELVIFDYPEIYGTLISFPETTNGPSIPDGTERP